MLCELSCSFTFVLAGVTKALKRMNGKMNLPQLQKIMMEFERESEIMDLKEETISDTIDDVLGEGDEEEVRMEEFIGSGRGFIIQGAITD